MNALRTCSNCGTPVTAPPAEGFCPYCMLEGALSLGAQTAARVENGETRLGDYQLLEEVARGGMGVVYKARQTTLDRLVAVKLILVGRFADEAVVRRFKAEAAAAARLRHPNIVSIHEIGEDNGRHFFSMEFIEGPNLSEFMKQQTLSLRQIAELMKAVAGAVHYAHEQGIVHRDLKPSNILIDCFHAPHITDFGLAKDLKTASDLTLTGQILGSPNYISPEQAAGKSSVGVRGDIYSLGAILYHLLSSRPPFAAETLTETLRQVAVGEPVSPRLLNPNVPRDLETICLKCLEKEPENRFSTAAELADELERYLEGEPIRARPISAPARALRWCRRKPVIAALAAAFSLSVLLGFAGVTWQWRRAERKAEESRRNLYAADIRLAQQIQEHGNLGRARTLLQGHLPEAGQRDLRGFEWRYLWNLYRGQQLHTFPRETDRVKCVAFSPDGELLAAGISGGLVKLWNVKTLQPEAALAVHPKLHCLAFSPDSRTLATGGNDDLVKFWDVADRKMRFSLSVEDPYRLAFSPSEPLLAIGSRDPKHSNDDDYGDLTGEVQLWDYNTRTITRVLMDAGVRVAFSADGRKLVTGSFDDSLKLSDAGTGEVIRIIEGAGPVLSLAIAQDGKTLASGNQDPQQLHLWDSATGEVMAELQGDLGFVWGVAISPDGKTLASANADHTVRLYEISTRKELATLRGHGNEVCDLAFSPDGNLLASGSKDGEVMLWKVPPETESEPIPGVISAPLFSSDGTVFATHCRDTHVRVRSTATQEIRMELSGERFALAFSPDRRSLKTLSADQSLRVWDLEKRAVKQTIPLAKSVEPIGWAFLSSDSKILATGGFDYRNAGWNGSEVTLWNALTGEVLTTLKNNGVAWNGAFSPDARTFAATCTRQKTATIWDVATGRELTRLPHGSDVFGVAYSPDGAMLATTAWDDTATIWSVSGWKKIATLPGHTQGAYGIAFSPDGRTLAVGSGDGTVKLWNIATHREIMTLRHGKQVELIVFSPDGTTLATVGLDRGLRLWRAPFPKE